MLKVVVTAVGAALAMIGISKLNNVHGAQAR